MNFNEDDDEIVGRNHGENNLTPNFTISPLSFYIIVLYVKIGLSRTSFTA